MGQSQLEGREPGSLSWPMHPSLLGTELGREGWKVYLSDGQRKDIQHCCSQEFSEFILLHLPAGHQNSQVMLRAELHIFYF